jgi:hypothetical protein
LNEYISLGGKEDTLKHKAIERMNNGEGILYGVSEDFDTSWVPFSGTYTVINGKKYKDSDNKILRSGRLLGDDKSGKLILHDGVLYRRTGSETMGAGENKTY